jgi:hypothetical protein
MPKELGNSKGITENPILKIELTKTNAFWVTAFGEYLDVKRKGRTPIAAKSKKEIPKKKRAKMIELDDKDEEMEGSEESDANNDEEDYEQDEDRNRKKVKLEKLVTKDYLGEYSFKNSPDKMGKPHCPSKAVWEVIQKNTKSSPLKAVPEETKKETVGKKMDNVEKIEISDKKMTDMEDKITKAVTNNLKDLLTQILEKQQPKQEVTIKEEIEEKDGDKDV